MDSQNSQKPNNTASHSDSVQSFNQKYGERISAIVNQPLSGDENDFDVTSDEEQKQIDADHKWWDEYRGLGLQPEEKTSNQWVAQVQFKFPDFGVLHPYGWKEGADFEEDYFKKQITADEFREKLYASVWIGDPTMLDFIENL